MKHNILCVQRRRVESFNFLERDRSRIFLFLLTRSIPTCRHLYSNWVCKCLHYTRVFLIQSMMGTAMGWCVIMISEICNNWMKLTSAISRKVYRFSYVKMVAADHTWSVKYSWWFACWDVDIQHSWIRNDCEIDFISFYYDLNMREFMQNSFHTTPSSDEYKTSPKGF